MLKHVAIAMTVVQSSLCAMVLQMLSVLVDLLVSLVLR